MIGKNGSFLQALIGVFVDECHRQFMENPFPLPAKKQIKSVFQKYPSLPTNPHEIFFLNIFISPDCNLIVRSCQFSTRYSNRHSESISNHYFVESFRRDYSASYLCERKQNVDTNILMLFIKLMLMSGRSFF